jgi:hypothetical protein
MKKRNAWVETKVTVNVNSRCKTFNLKKVAHNCIVLIN